MNYCMSIYSLICRIIWICKRNVCIYLENPMVLALEKHNKQLLKRCCSACSVGKRCIKYRQEEADVELLIQLKVKTMEQGRDRFGFREGEKLLCWK